MILITLDAYICLLVSSWNRFHHPPSLAHIWSIRKLYQNYFATTTLRRQPLCLASPSKKLSMGQANYSVVDQAFQQLCPDSSFWSGAHTTHQATLSPPKPPRKLWSESHCDRGDFSQGPGTGWRSGFVSTEVRGTEGPMRFGEGTAQATSRSRSRSRMPALQRQTQTAGAGSWGTTSFKVKKSEHPQLTVPLFLWSAVPPGSREVSRICARSPRLLLFKPFPWRTASRLSSLWPSGTASTLHWGPEPLSQAPL